MQYFVQVYSKMNRLSVNSDDVVYLFQVQRGCKSGE